MKLNKRLEALEKVAPKYPSYDLTTGVKTIEDGITVIRFKQATSDTAPDSRQCWHTVKVDSDGFEYERIGHDMTLIFKDAPLPKH